MYISNIAPSKALCVLASSKALDAVRHHARDDELLAFFEGDRRESHISGLECDLLTFEKQMLHREVPIHLGHHNIHVHRLERTIDNNDVTLINACRCHGSAGHPPIERRLGVRNQQLVQVLTLDGEVGSGRWEAPTHAALDKGQGQSLKGGMLNCIGR
jgi:hypothetical protein